MNNWYVIIHGVWCKWVCMSVCMGVCACVCEYVCFSYKMNLIFHNFKGKSPFSDKPDEEARFMIADGQRLSKPRNCSNEMYVLCILLHVHECCLFYLSNTITDINVMLFLFYNILCIHLCTSSWYFRYDIMCSCWMYQPHKRPSLDDVESQLLEITQYEIV